MARFTFGKNKKRLEEANTSYNSESVEQSPVSNMQQSPVASPIKERPQRIKPQAVPPAIAVDGQGPWKRHKLFNSPFPRYRHSAAMIASDKNEVFLMGGLKEGSVFGDTWKIAPQESPMGNGEISGYEATPIEIVNLNNPPARVGHSSVLCGNAYIIFGGDTVDTDFNGFPDNNFYLFNINNNKYTIPSHALNKPSGRYGHTIGVISLHNSSSKLFLFGGQLENDVFNDLYFFELNKFKSPKARWELVEPLNNFKPPPLTNHSLSVYKNKIYVFGGVYNNEKISNDLWCFDALVNKWTQVATTGNVPLPVNEHASCIVDDKLFVYGGNDFSGIIYNSLYVLDLHSLEWSKLVESGEKDGPGPRCGHSITYLPKYNKLIIMGGDKNDYVNSNQDDFETYEIFNGEECGTMVYELDLDLVDYFLSSTPASKFGNKKMAASAGAVGAGAVGAGAVGAGVATAASAKAYDDRNSLTRHARSISAGPEDFKTPNVSPERIPKAANISSSQQSEFSSTQPQDKFVDVDVPSGNISERDDSYLPSDDDTQDQSRDIIGASGHNGHHQDNTYDFSSTEDLRDTNNATPILNKGNAIAAPMTNGKINSEDAKVKKLVNELTSELNELKSSTKAQMQNATERISGLEKENALLKGNDKTLELQNQLNDRDDLIYELKSQVDPSALAINEDETPGRSIGKGGISELNKYKLERLELNNRLIYLEQENTALTSKFENFEPFMNNQIGELANFQKIIKVQEEKIAKLSGQVKDQEPLHREINDWKNKFHNLQLEFENFRTINADEQFSENQANEEGTRSMAANSSGVKSKKDIASHLEHLIGLWSAKNAGDSRGLSSEDSNPENSPMVSKLQKQLDDLLKISKQQEMGSSTEIQNLKNELSIKLQNLKTFEENYRDALQSVNNTSKALNLTQDELNNQRIMMEKLIKENNELKLYKRASKRVSSRTPLISEGQFESHNAASPSIPESGNADEEDFAISNVHYNMKVKDLQADLFILKQERDQLKDNVTILQKQLYLAHDNQ